MDIEQSDKNKLLFSKPKILLIDLSDDIIKKIQEDGFNVMSASFGKNVSIKKFDGYNSISPNDFPQYYTEREIIIINLINNFEENQPNHLSTNKSSFWINQKNGIISNRPLTMARYKKNFDRILNSGGIFVIFADNCLKTEYFIGKEINGSLDGKKFLYDNWSFLSLFKHAHINKDSGEEIVIKDEIKNDTLHKIASFFKQKLNNAFYLANISFYSYVSSRWTPFLFNKHKEAIGGLIKPSGSSKGYVLILPKLN